MQDAGPVADVLRMQRQVEADLVAKRADVGGGGAFAEHHLDGIAGDKMDEQKDQRHHQPDNRKSEQRGG